MSLVIIQGFLGFFFLLLIAFLFSENKKAINWKLILIAFVLQNILFLLIRYVPAVNGILQLMAAGLLKFMDYANEGANFVFGGLADKSKYGFIFALVVVPTVIFFGSVISILYFLGILQWIITLLAYVLRRTIKLSGVESLIVIADIFLGQSEGPLVIGPYIHTMTRSELACAFIAGLANISGSTLGMYLAFLGHGDHVQEMIFAQSLITATFMNAASAIVFAKIFYPETEYDKILDPKHIKAQGVKAASLIDALMHGAFLGCKVGVAICVAISAIIPIVHAINGLLFWLGDFLVINASIIQLSHHSFNGLSLEFIFGLIFRIFAFFMGIPWAETLQVGSLLGQKVAINEFVAFMSLGQMKASGLLSASSIFISTFALASFSNFGSIGVSLAAFSTLAPGRQKELAQMSFKALTAAVLAGFMTATVAGFWHNLLG